jgi:1,2-diacylglycerol 3-beta-galactosyltransferase
MALKEAFDARPDLRVECKLIDTLEEYSPAPLDLMPDAYGQIIKRPKLLWTPIYKISDGPRRAKFFTQAISAFSWRGANRLVEENPSDLFVSVYHLANAPVYDALERHGLHTPFVTVVTDLVTTPPVWYDKRASLTIVPTEAARTRAIGYGMPPGRVQVIGLPISGRFSQSVPDRKMLRQQLGWATDRRVLLLFAGGEGRGPLLDICDTISDAGLNVTVAVVTGKNARLRRKLERRAKTYPMPVHVYGYVSNMPDIMAASDILATKAGPGTICEALASGLPMLIYAYLPGQEEGNVSLVTESGAGFWVPTTDELVFTLRNLLTNPEALERASHACRALAKPQAGPEIVNVLAGLIS